MLILFFKYLEKHTYKSQNTLDNFLLISFFKYLKKHTYESENTLDNFLLIAIFEIFEKAYLQISKYLFHIDNNFKRSNPHKNHYTNNFRKNHYRHKAKYIITDVYQKLI